LCPFAAEPRKAGRVRTVVTDGSDLEGALTVCAEEVAGLLEHSPEQRSTTLIALPAWGSYTDFLDLLGSLDALLNHAQATGIVQVVGFHPEAVFADEPADDPANYAARAPMAVVHLLREDEVAAAVAAHPDAQGISLRNAKHLRARAASGNWPPF